MGGTLNGKVAVVTGSGRGIGQAIAVAYAAEGAAVCCTARTKSEIEDTLSQIEEIGGTGIAISADVTEIESVKSIFDSTYEELGGLDILVCNAGGHSEGKFVEHSNPGIWKAVLDSNLYSAYLCSQAAIPYLKQRGGGKIINLGSGMGHRGIPGNSAYACAKAGLWMLTRVLAQELHKEKISVNELIPGLVQTSMFPGDSAEEIQASTGEWLKEPEDVVPMALFLATQPLVGPTAQSFSLMRRDN